MEDASKESTANTSAERMTAGALSKGLPTAYLFHSINLTAALLTVPLLLHYLDVTQYVQWTLFTTLAGLTLHIEASLQILSVRQMSREFHSGSIAAFHGAVKNVRTNYLLLSLMTLVPFTLLGGAYLAYISDQPLGDHWLFEWVILTVTYSLNYYMGTNNSILLALEKNNFFFSTMSLTRIINLAGILILLHLGLGVLGICLAFAASVILGCAAIAVRAHSAKVDVNRSATHLAQQSSQPPASTNFGSTEAAKYTLYTFAAFAVYRGSGLIAASVYDTETVASYMLAIMAYTMITAICVVPTQIWLGRFVRTILAKDRNGIVRELARVLILANSAFVLATSGLVTIAPHVLNSIGSSVALPGTPTLLWLAIAFLAEMNLFLFVNMLVIMRDFRFVLSYVISATVAITLAITGVVAGFDVLIALVILPFVAQSVVAAPAILLRAASHIGLSRRQLLVRIATEFLPIRPDARDPL